MANTRRRSKKAKDKWDDPEPSMGEKVLKMTNGEMIRKIRSLENEVKSMKSEMMRISPKIRALNEKVKTKKTDKTLPYSVYNVNELSDFDSSEDSEEDEAVVNSRAKRKRGAIGDIFYDVLTDEKLFVEFVIYTIILYSSVQILLLAALYFLDKSKFNEYVMWIQQIPNNVLSSIYNNVGNVSDCPFLQNLKKISNDVKN
ncbi:uncharacterized protein LOC135839875 isoform X1 [Planococcus citri]|uniref:uncharacterized protein LOC135839875 isoform X1 n=1 Tax=Planococcus citri TaxID=170843 RepID=UPI0031F94FB5